jgi:hypothetical protein
MEVKYFSLGSVETNIFFKTVRIAFGIVCIGIAVFWVIFNLSSLKADINLWITIIFLSGFGVYQIWAGLGRAVRFIEISSDQVRLKKNSILPAIVITSATMEKIELFPFNVVFFLKTKKRIIFRFGNTFSELNEKIKDELMNFAESKDIPIEIIQEKL